jgi:hypothetical protein
VIVLALIAVVLLLVMRNRRRARELWRNETVNALDATRLAVNLLPASGVNIPDVAHWQSVRDRVEQAARALEHSSAIAPDDEGREAARRAAEALRGLVFALEADRLLRDGVQPPTPEQLADADATTRTRRTELEVALRRLEAMVRPQEQVQ